MANKSCFKLRRQAATDGRRVTKREAPRPIALSPKHQLAQIAVTGRLARTFYATARGAARRCDGVGRPVEPQFVAQAAI